MTDYTKALAAARIAATRHRTHGYTHLAAEALIDLLAALDAAQGEAVAVAWIHEGDIATNRSNPDNVAYVLAKPGRLYHPLYLAPQAPPAAVPADTHGDEFGRGWNACRAAMLAAAKENGNG